MSVEDYQIILDPQTDHLQVYPLTQPGIMIGREAGLEIVIDAVSVSRRHARILRRGDVFYLEDLNSSNGTFLNGERMNGPAVLSPGDQIRLGLSVEIQFDAPATVRATLVPETGLSQITSAADPHARETVIGEVDLPDAAEEPPVLEVRIAGENSLRFKLAQQVLTLGR